MDPGEGDMGVKRGDGDTPIGLAGHERARPARLAWWSKPVLGTPTVPATGQTPSHTTLRLIRGRGYPGGKPNQFFTRDEEKTANP